VVFARQLYNMLQLARVIAQGAALRNESRGAHYKPDFPDRDDENFLKTTIAEFSGEGPVFSWEPVDIGLIPPRKRDYSKGSKQETKQAAVVAEASAAGLPPKESAKQVPEEGWDQKPTTGPAIWGQDKEKVDRGVSGDVETRTERGDSIKDAGGKTDKL
ncbi:MAG TPA: hypothetical protein VFA21_18845, partial [Pyrinomonadaceae bacterium]|nr:hypothetical protein [Pyrinomonadaceae bacterium]